MKSTELIILIGLWVAILALVFYVARKRRAIPRRVQRELTSKVLDPAYVKNIRKEIHESIENSVNQSLASFVKDNEALHDHLKTMTEKAVVKYIDGAHKKLEGIYVEHANQLAAIISDAETSVNAQVSKFEQQLESIGNEALPAKMKEFSSQLEAIQTQVIPPRVQAFEEKLNDLTLGLVDIKSDITKHSAKYRTQVNQRIVDLVDAQATEVLANYLDASLSGIDFGEQQDIILERLEQNKDALKSELDA